MERTENDKQLFGGIYAFNFNTKYLSLQFSQNKKLQILVNSSYDHTTNYKGKNFLMIFIINTVF